MQKHGPTRVAAAGDVLGAGAATFEIPIPSDVASSYRGTHSYSSYILQVSLDIAWGFDIGAQTPIVVVR